MAVFRFGKMSGKIDGNGFISGYGDQITEKREIIWRRLQYAFPQSLVWGEVLQSIYASLKFEWDRERTFVSEHRYFVYERPINLA